MSISLEIAVFNLESALDAIYAGADRIEFCENPAEGGTTPSYGSLSRLIQIATQPVFPIIRPRGGDFLYSDEEFEIVKADVQLVKELGYPGCVVGLLLPDGNIDINRTAELVAIAGNMEVTFHRAFDRCVDPFKGVEDVIKTGCKRILTSGQVPNAFDAMSLIEKLVAQAEGRIIIMPGSGVRANNIVEIVRKTGVTEIHSSARKTFPSQMYFNAPSMKEQLFFTGVDEAEIKAMKSAISN